MKDFHKQKKVLKSFHYYHNLYLHLKSMVTWTNKFQDILLLLKQITISQLMGSCVMTIGQFQYCLTRVSTKPRPTLRRLVPLILALMTGPHIEIVEEIILIRAIFTSKPKDWSPHWKVSNYLFQSVGLRHQISSEISMVDNCVFNSSVLNILIFSSLF